MTDLPRITVIAASGRALGMSLMRAGREVRVLDGFCDTDLEGLAPQHRIPLGDEMLDVLQQMPEEWFTGPIVFGGGMENRLDVLEFLSERGTLLGPDAETIRTLRDPEWLQNIVADAGGHALAIRKTPILSDDYTGWIIKPYRSAGGVGVDFYWGEEFDETEFYLQRIGRNSFDGTGERHGDSIPFGAIYCGFPEGFVRRCHRIGISRQMDHHPEIDYIMFGYFGSTVPLQFVDLGTLEILDRIAERIVLETDLRGVFGLDGFVNVPPPGEVSRPNVIEINPRYTASFELHEFATGLPLMTRHLMAYGEESPPDRRRYPQRIRESIAKRIVYKGEESGVWRPTKRFGALTTLTTLGTIADVPEAGTRIGGLGPICTFFATGSPDRIETIFEELEIDFWHSGSITSKE